MSITTTELLNHIGDAGDMRLTDYLAFDQLTTFHLEALLRCAEALKLEGDLDEMNAELHRQAGNDTPFSKTHYVDPDLLLRIERANLDSYTARTDALAAVAAAGIEVAS